MTQLRKAVLTGCLLIELEARRKYALDRGLAGRGLGLLRNCFPRDKLPAGRLRRSKRGTL
jgi:hypothetical protein